MLCKDFCSIDNVVIIYNLYFNWHDIGVHLGAHSIEIYFLLFIHQEIIKLSWVEQKCLKNF